MQIGSNGSDSARSKPDTSEPNELTQLKRYWQALKRRWVIVVALAVIGAAVGWVTTPDAKAETPPPAEGGDPQTEAAVPADSPYFRATHKLIVDPGSLDPTGAATPSINISQAAYFATTGEVPERAAAELGIPAREISDNVSAKAYGDVQSVEVTAIGTDPDEIEAMADVVALHLVDYLNELETQTYERQRDEIITRVDELEAERTEIEGRLADDPDNSFLQAEYDAVANDYRLAQENLRAFAQAAQPSTGLTSVEDARAVRISEEDYENRKALIAAGSDAAVMVPSTLPPAPTSEAPETPPSAPLRAGLGGFFGLAVGLALVILIDRYDTRLRRREEVETATGLPVLAEIPPLTRRQQHETEVLSAASTRSPMAEAFRIVRTALMLSRVEGTAEEPGFEEQRGYVIMVSSANPNEGKTTSVANLAAVLAEGGDSVLVVDCDFRRPRVDKYLHHDHPELGEESQPLGAMSGPGQGRLEATDYPGVKLVRGIGDGLEDANPSTIVAQQKKVIEVARRHYDIVLLDTAPFLTTNDAVELLSETDAVLFVVRCGMTRSSPAARAAEVLQRVEAPVLGVLFTAADETPATYYYYDYYLDTTGSKGRERRRRRESGHAGNGAAEADRPGVGPPELPTRAPH